MSRRLSKISVAVRKRPLNRKEQERGEADVVSVPSEDGIIVHEPKVKVDMTKYVEDHLFRFDHSFGEDATNEEIYVDCVRPLLDTVFERGKASCFAYGQTGSGKTHTMMGRPRVMGLYLLAAAELFDRVQREHPELTVWCSFFEIYGGKLFDLLNDRKPVVAREDAKKVINVVGLIEHGPLPNVQSLMEIIEYGNSSRKTGSTGANEDSSRSHAILHIHLRDDRTGLRFGKISFIDLAGSERGADTAHSNRVLRLEGAEINKSLLALKEVFRALSRNDDKHIPFRGSKLTAVLRDSFVGNCRTLMIANISPNSSGCEHAMNTLRYADRVKELRGGPSGGGAARGGGEVRRPGRLAQPQPPAAAAVAASSSSRPSGMPRAAAVISELEREERHFCDGDEMSTGEEEEDEEPMAMTVHQKLMATILDEGDLLVEEHKRSIDEHVALVKEELKLLKYVDQEESDPGVYAKEAIQVLARKRAVMDSIEEKLKQFLSHLEEEDALASTMSPKK